MKSYFNSTSNQIFKSRDNLPSISMSNLQKSLGRGCKKNDKQMKLLRQGQNHKQINVISPFYDRMVHHKQNCKCPFHKRMKYRPNLLKNSKSQIDDEIPHGRFSVKNQRTGQTFGRSKFRLSNKQFCKSSLNKTQSDQNTQWYDYSGIKHKILADNLEYQKFLKEYRMYALKNGGFNRMGQFDPHIIKKGVKQIFKFIKQHLDYTVKEMRSALNQFQKDKQYGEFYIQRFIEMKQAHEKGKRNAHLKKSDISNNSNKNQVKLKKLKNGSKGSNGSSNDQIGRDPNAPKISLRKLIGDLQANIQIMDNDLHNFMHSSLCDFKATFKQINVDILDCKYDDKLLDKFQKLIMKELKRRSSLKLYSDSDEKLKIINETFDCIQRSRANSRISRFSSPLHRSRNSSLLKKSANSKQKRSSIFSNNFSNNLNNNQDSDSQSNENSDDSDNQHEQDDFDANLNELPKAVIEQKPKGLLHSKSKIIKTLIGMTQTRRSKIKPKNSVQLQDDAIEEDSKSNQDSSQQSQGNDRENQKTKKGHHGLFQKAQIFLYQVKMSKAIVKKQDSLFTAKRKLRVIKNMIQDNAIEQQAAKQLQEYVKFIQQRCKKNKKLISNEKTAFQVQTDHLTQINLDNMGFNLIFYDLTAKIKLENNEDLCILLSQLKNVGTRNDKSLQNEVTYKKMHWEDEYDKKETCKNISPTDNYLIQKQLNQMELQPQYVDQTPQIDAKSQFNLRRTQRSFTRRSRFDNSFVQEVFLDEQQYKKERIKAIFAYTRDKFPNSFNSFLKNSSSIPYSEQF